MVAHHSPQEFFPQYHSQTERSGVTKRMPDVKTLENRKRAILAFFATALIAIAAATGDGREGYSANEADRVATPPVPTMLAP